MLSFALLFTACKGGVTFRSKLDVDTGEVQFAQPQSGDTVAQQAKALLKYFCFLNMPLRRYRILFPLPSQDITTALHFTVL